MLQFDKFSIVVLLCAIIATLFLVNVDRDSVPPMPESPSDSVGFAAHPLSSSFSSVESSVYVTGSRLSVSDNIIYQTGFYSINGSSWIPFNMSGPTYNNNGKWLRGSASRSLPTFGPGEHYVLIYSCNRSNNAWDCHGNKFQLILINNTASTASSGSSDNISAQDSDIIAQIVFNGGSEASSDCGDALDYQCGTRTICGQSVNYGTCPAGYGCNNNLCIALDNRSCNGVICASGEYCSHGACLLTVSGKTYFVALWGDDDWPGNFTHPFYSWQKPVGLARPGDIIYFRGGVWQPASRPEGSRIFGMSICGPTSYNTAVSGTKDAPIRYYNYPKEKPILDGQFIAPDEHRWSGGISLEGIEHIHLRGLTVRHIHQSPPDFSHEKPYSEVYGIGSSGANIHYENMVAHDIDGRGFQHWSYAWSDVDAWYSIEAGYQTTYQAPLFESDSTSWINCDAYNLYDRYAMEPGNAADGWKVQGYYGNDFYWEGCRAFNYADDGFDPSGDAYRTFKNCWAMATNKYEGISNVWSTERNGFKMTGVNPRTVPNYVQGKEHYVRVENCMAVDCAGSGFVNNILVNYEDSWPNNGVLYNNFAYRDGYGYMDAKASIYRNNIVYDSQNIDPIGQKYEVWESYSTEYNGSNNVWREIEDWPGWEYNPSFNVTDTDFVSLNVSQLMRPRKSDGSLPDITFGHLATGSDLIDTGANVGLPYNGASPDLGAFEYVGITCTNECSLSGSTQCFGSLIQACGNYDADSCYEWGTATSCPSGQTCSGGSCSGGSGNVYYVSNSGSDNNDGLTQSTAWKTISKINGKTFQPGDAILFERGGIWREQMEIPSGGNSTHYLTFSSYGNGEKPKILGSKAGTTWTETASGSHIWKSDVTFSDPPMDSDLVFRNLDGSGKFGVKKSGTSGLTADYDWAYSSSYIYVYSTTNPSTKYESIEVPQRKYCVSTNDKPYLHFDGIDCFYAGYTGYDSNNDHTISNVHGMIIESCEIGFVGGQTYDDIGFCISTIYSDMIIRNNSIYHCGRRGIALDVYNEGSKFTIGNILVEDNRLYNGYHTTGIDIDVGAVGSSNINNLTIRNNFMYEETTHTSDFSNFIFIQNNYVSACDITNIYIYNNIFQRANGAAIMAEGIEGPIYIYNNIFYNHDPNAESWMAYIMPQTKDGQRSNSIVKNNIFHGGEGTQFTSMEVWGSWNQHDYNLFYNSNSDSESHIVYGNPLFVDAANDNFNLQAGSPAINKGTDVSSVRTTDYDRNPLVGLPDLGAFEYQSIVCTDTCSSLKYSCGNMTVCNRIVDCGNCSAGFSCAVNSSCVKDNIASVCGDGQCNGEETCSSCSTDCGNCPYGNVYYISTTGSDTSGTGTSTNPWKTLYKACNNVTSAGSTIYVNPGTYSETQQCLLRAGVSIMGAGNSSVITSTTITSEWEPIVKMHSSSTVNGNQSISYVKFDGNNRMASQAIDIRGRHNVKIHHCTFTNFRYVGVGWTTATATMSSPYITGSEFYNNTVINCAGYPDDWQRGALLLGGQDGMLIHHNYMVENSSSDQGLPIKFWYWDGDSKGVKIYDNYLKKTDFSGWDFAIESNYEQGMEIYNNRIVGALDLNYQIKGSYDYSVYVHDNVIGPDGPITGWFPQSSGIILEFSSEAVLIERNLIVNSSPCFLFTPRNGNIDGITIRYNICRDVRSSGYYNEGLRVVEPSGIQIRRLYMYNNILQGYSASALGNAISISTGGSGYTGSDLQFVNNIIMNFGNGAPMTFSTSAIDGINIQNNIFYNNGNNNQPSFTGIPTNYVNSGNIASNPLFVGLSSGDYHLQPNSPAINAGKNVSLVRDFAGNIVPVGSFPDIGAFESNQVSGG